MLVFFVLLFSSIELYTHFTQETNPKNSAESYRNYSLDLLKNGALSPLIELEDSTLSFCPELGFVIPTTLRTLKEIAKKDVVPLLRVQNENHIFLQIKGFRSFKNRGIRTKKLLQKRLGRYYNVQFSESIHGAFLSIAYTGEPWKIDNFLALPVAIAAKPKDVPPENILAFYASLYAVDSLSLFNRIPPDSVTILLKSSNTGRNDSTTFAYAIRTAFPLMANDSATIAVYTSSALGFANYFRKYGLRQ